MDSTPLHSGQPRPIPDQPDRASGGAGSSRPGSADPGAIRFRGLLERLEALESGAETLSRETTSDSLEVEDLSGAVDRARATLEDALSLGGRLLEAYQESIRRSTGTDS